MTEVPPLEQRIDDMRAVMDAAGVESAALYGISEGGPASILFAATDPERISKLVLYGSVPRFSAGEGYPWGPDESQQAALLEEVERDWGETALLKHFAPSLADDPGLKAVWGQFLRSGASPAMGLRVMRAMMEIDVRDVLPTINIPTLILHRSGDKIAPVEGARLMADRIPDAHYVEFDEPDHLPFVGDTEAIGDEIEEFLTGTRGTRKWIACWRR